MLRTIHFPSWHGSFQQVTQFTDSTLNKKMTAAPIPLILREPRQNPPISRHRDAPFIAFPDFSQLSDLSFISLPGSEHESCQTSTGSALPTPRARTRPPGHRVAPAVPSRLPPSGPAPGRDSPAAPATAPPPRYPATWPPLARRARDGVTSCGRQGKWRRPGEGRASSRGWVERATGERRGGGR